MPQAVVAAWVAVGAFLEAHAIIQFFAYVAGSILLQKITERLFGPKAGKTSFAGRQTTSRGSLDYRKFVYGEALVGGTIIYNNTHGTNNEWLDYHIAYLDHEISSVISFKVDTVTVPVADIDWTPPAINGNAGTGTGNVSTSDFVGLNSHTALKISWYPGHADQPANTLLTANYASLGVNHRARGVFNAVIQASYVQDSEKVWEKGEPREVLTLVKGRLIYDPRLDTTNGGTGLHRYTDDTTWEWSDNPALCLADYLMTYMLSDPAEDIDWASVIAAADDCDVVVSVPAPVSTQKRFTCNGVFTADDSHEVMIDDLKQSMAGRLSWTNGQWTMWAGTWVAPTLTFDETTFKGDIQVTGSAAVKERYNAVRGFYIDPDREYKAVEFFPAENSAFLARDNGKPLDFEMDFRFSNSEYQCQRLAIRKLEQFDNQRTATFVFDAEGAKVYAGLEFDVNFGELSWVNKTFRCIGWTPLGDGRFEIRAQEDFASRYTDPLVGSYTTRTSTGAIVTPALVIPPPTGLVATGQGGIVQLDWVNPPSSFFEWIEVWVSTTNDIGTASKVTDIKSNSYSHVVSDTVTRYYWVRARLLGEDWSVYEPATTIGVTGVASSATVAEWQYIKPTNGTAIQNGVGTLTIEAREVSAGVDSLIASGTVKLFEGTTEITVANGYAAGSDGYTGVFDSGDITGNVVIELKDGPTGTPVDTITLVDVADGAAGGDGADAIYGYIEPENGLAWTRAINSGAWTPGVLTTDLDVTFVQGGVAVARISRRITLTSSTGALASSVTTHPLTDLNTSRVTVTISGSGSGALTASFAYSFAGENATVAETVKSVFSGTDGGDGLNVATAFIYQRTATDSAPTLPSVTATYTFATGNITGLNNGWTDTVPAFTGSNPFLWVTLATASNTGTTDSILNTEWQAAQKLAENGTDGSAGADGFNTATLTAYKRAVVAPTDNPGALTYTFSTAGWTPANGWSKEIPTGTDALYAVSATAFSQASTDNILAGDWSTPTLILTETAGSAALNIGSAMKTLSHWWSNNTQTSALPADWSIATVSGGPAGTIAMKIVDNDAGSEDIFSERMIVTPGSKYRVSIQANQFAGDRTNYLLVAFYDSAGTVIVGSTGGATGWGGLGTYNYWNIVNAAFPSSWTAQSFEFGGDATATIPAGAVTMAIGGLFSRSGTTSTTIFLQDYRIVELAIGGTLRDIKFQRNTAQPATPTGDNPAGWFDEVPSGTDTLWQITGTKNAGGVLQGVWSTPAQIQGLVYRGSWVTAIPYILHDVVTFQERSYICVLAHTSLTTTREPSGTNSGNTWWDLLAGKGDTGDPPTAFNQTIQITGTGPINLRALADAHTPAYDGVGAATIIYQLATGITITGNAGGGHGIDTGSWPSVPVIDLKLEITGTVRGGGGTGGTGGNGVGGNGQPGVNGGDAIYLQEPMISGITVNSGGVVQASGGGGGGGGGASYPGFEPLDRSGGGGGGGFPNGGGGAAGTSSNFTGSAGSAGTTGGGGAGGAGAGLAGTGGGGGNVNVNGSIGAAGTSSGNNGGGGAAGARGYAVRKNGHAATVTNNGTITGTQG